jgi:sec-independent protein translocase protein TatB
MFDIGFSEMLVIAVVALIVIGPERLPKVARTLGLLFGRMQRYVNDVKSDISREMELDELRKLQATVEEAARAIETSVTKEVAGAKTALNEVAADASVSAELQSVATAAEAPPSEASPPAALIADGIAASEPPAITPPAVTAPAVAPAVATPQLELGLESVQTAQKKQA